MPTTLEQTTELSMKLRLSKRASEKLAEWAAKSGQDVSTVASDLIEHAASMPSLSEILAPVRADFARSGMTEEELIELGRRELDALRKEKAEQA